MTNQADAVKLAAIERTAGWRTIMGTPASRRVMWERFEVMGIYQVSPIIEPYALAYNEGKRSLALQVMNDLLAECPDLHDRMVSENRKRLAVELAQSQLEGGEE